MPKLLIVDDEIDIREFAKNFFKKRGIEVFTAAGGNEALGIIAEENPDLLLLDVRMEEMTGVDLLTKVRATGNQVKAMMVTGVEDDAVIHAAQDLGIQGYIHKPLVLEELEKLVLKELQSADA